jgi:hypothetical protein
MYVYISGSITKNENYKEDFLKAENLLKQNNHYPINPSKLNDLLPDLTYEQYMSIDYKLIELSEAIYMLKGWQKSKGACAELSYAKSLGKKVIYQKYFKEFRNVSKSI